MAAFDRWAEYYDLVHRGLPGEAEFYVGQAVRLGAKTLELGCGTGRISIAMAMSGVETTGLDNSPDMLEVCRAKLEAVGAVDGSLKLVQADMSDFRLDERFDLIVMPYRTFMHLQRPVQQSQCLRRIRQHLERDGLFILNTWIPRAAHLAKYGGKGKSSDFEFIDEYPLPESTDRLRHYHRQTVDEFQQRLIEEHRFDEVSAEGVTLDSSTLPLIRVWTTKREMEHLVCLNGFRVEALFGDFDCNPLTNTSTEMIWVLKKGRETPASEAAPRRG